MEKPPFIPPTTEQARKHWQAQEPSVWREPGQRDPGLSIVPTKDAVRTILEREAEGDPVSLYRAKSAATPVHDPVFETQTLIRDTKGMPLNRILAEECRSVEQMMLVNAIKGEMTAAQRSVALTKVADILFRQQQEAAKQHNQLKRDEDRKTQIALAALKAMKNAGGGVE